MARKIRANNYFIQTPSIPIRDAILSGCPIFTIQISSTLLGSLVWYHLSCSRKTSFFPLPSRFTPAHRFIECTYWLEELHPSYFDWTFSMFPLDTSLFSILDRTSWWIPVLLLISLNPIGLPELHIISQTLTSRAFRFNAQSWRQLSQSLSWFMLHNTLTCIYWLDSACAWKNGASVPQGIW